MKRYRGHIQLLVAIIQTTLCLRCLAFATWSRFAALRPQLAPERASCDRKYLLLVAWTQGSTAFIMEIFMFFLTSNFLRNITDIFKIGIPHLPVSAFWYALLELLCCFLVGTFCTLCSLSMIVSTQCL